MLGKSLLIAFGAIGMLSKEGGWLAVPSCYPVIDSDAPVSSLRRLHWRMTGGTISADVVPPSVVAPIRAATDGGRFVLLERSCAMLGSDRHQ